MNLVGQEDMHTTAQQKMSIGTQDSKKDDKNRTLSPKRRSRKIPWCHMMPQHGPERVHKRKGNKLGLKMWVGIW